MSDYFSECIAWLRWNFSQCSQNFKDSFGWTFVRYFLLFLFIAQFSKKVLFHSSQFINSEFYEISLVADNDDKTPVDNGVFKTTLVDVVIHLSKPFDTKNNSVIMKWVLQKVTSLSSIEMKDFTRGLSRYMELSALTVFDGLKLTCDDRTGHLLKIENEKEIFLWLDLGQYIPNFKCEWLTVKDGYLYAGSFGKPFINPKTSKVIHNNFLKVFKVSTNKTVEIIDWTETFDKLKESLNVKNEGFVIHEGVEWIPEVRKWIIMPRREVNTTYTVETDDAGCSSAMLICDENFTEIQVIRLADTIPTRGFSDVSYSIHKSPTGELIYFIWASRTQEIEDKFNSDIVFITCKNLDQTGQAQCQIFDEALVGKDQKLEGILARNVNSFFIRAYYYFVYLKNGL